MSSKIPPNAIIAKAGRHSPDTVLEIGPGTGNLTLKMLEMVKNVIAVEYDPSMVVELNKRMHGSEYAHKQPLQEVVWQAHHCH